MVFEPSSGWDVISCLDQQQVWWEVLGGYCSLSPGHQHLLAGEAVLNPLPWHGWGLAQHIPSQTFLLLRKAAIPQLFAPYSQAS